MPADTLYATPVNDYPRTADIERPEPAGAAPPARGARRPGRGGAPAARGGGG
jgi:hypothetical protein